MIGKMTSLMSVTDSSPLICLLCHSSIDLNAFTNIFYTCFPESGETLSNFVLKILNITNTELPSSYLCLKCFNTFWMLEQAQTTAINVQSEILSTFQTKINDKLTNDILDNTLKDIETAEVLNLSEKLDETDKLQPATSDYLTEKDLHSLKSIINQATSDTVISIEIITKPVNDSSPIIKTDGSQAFNYLLNEPQRLNNQESNVPSDINTMGLLESNNSAFTLDITHIPKTKSKDQSQLEVCQDGKYNCDAGIQCDFSDYEDLESLISEDLDITPQDSPKRHSCDNCDQVFDSEILLRSHFLNIHPDLRPYVCEKCGKAYKHKNALEIHLGLHSGFSPHKCPKCGKCFTQKGALQRHIPLHTGEAPYQCEICNKRFVHHTSYHMHRLSHTGKKAYQCNICDIYLLSTSHLKRHMRVHTGEKPYKCTHCDKSFSERYNLQAHQKIHDPEQAAVKEAKRNQHKCVRCTATFSTKAKYMEHLRVHVGELTNEKPRAKLNKSNTVIITKKMPDYNGEDLLATCVNEVWQSLSLEETGV